MTIQEILANNSKQEDISIILCSQRQYDDFMRLLDKQGYTWSSGTKTCGEDCFVPDEFETQEDYMLFTITLDSERKTITYTNFFLGIDEEGFDYEIFYKSSNFLFGEDNENGEPFVSIYKPYLCLKKELEDWAEDYWV